MMETLRMTVATRLLHATASVASLVVALIAWEVVARANVVSSFLLPSLSDVLVRVYSQIIDGQLFVDLEVTVWRALAGFTLAGVFGTLIGLSLTRNSAVRWFFDPLISVGLPAPKIAFLPVFILWFGLFDISKILMAAFAAIFPVIAATAAGAQGVDKFLIWSARSAGASERQVLGEIIMPAALPEILTALQVALPICMIVTIVSEMTMGGDGLGASMLNAARFADSVGVFAGIVEVAVTGIALIKILEFTRRRLLLWHQESQE
jgi:ABC-type nitrate/sulfonate/bicarbonate transport system permease component